MRRLSKIFAFFLIIAMTQVSFASAVTTATLVPSDVTNDYTSAVTRLQILGLINSYPDGKFTSAFNLFDVILDDGSGHIYSFCDSSAANTGLTSTVTINLGVMDNPALQTGGYDDTGLVILIAGAVKDAAGNDCNAESGMEF